MHRWNVAALTHRGRVRLINEDSIAVHRLILTGDMTEPLVRALTNDICALMIADGMGGHAQGALASHAVLDHLVANADQLAEPATCIKAIQDTNDHLYGLMQTQPGAIGMGSTLVGAVLMPSQLVVFNVGDSRAYLQTSDHLVQLSHDDVRDNDANASGRRISHAITQALGGSEFPVPINPHVSTDPPLALGETLLLCSDGLTDMITDSVISSA
jgi:PPM family protein phosphatase